jgi:thiamine-phosphate pyrophosphorylase
VVRKFRERSGSLRLKRIVYLISPKKIDRNFYNKLDEVLSIKNVKFFQLRLKNTKKNKLIIIAKKVKVITKKYNVKLIINDRWDISKITNADGCHLGQTDGLVRDAKKNYKKQIVGVTCHNSKLLARAAIKNKADYLAFGSFNKSKLKPKAKRANLDILIWAKRNIKKPIVAIGGINNLNYKKFLKSGANYIAISSYIWDNPRLKPKFAIRKFK